MTPLYCFYHESKSGHSIKLDAWEAYAPSSMPLNREMMIWMDENTDGIHVIDSLEDSKHTIDGMRYVIFSSILLELDNCNEILFIK